MTLNPLNTNTTQNILTSFFQSMQSQVHTALPVEVVKVDTNKQTVSLESLVSMVDNEGNKVEYGLMSNVPYIRLQASNYGIIIDPKVGDKGLAIFCSRDISNVKKSKIPASHRKHSISDGIYIASLFNGKPKTYLKFNDNTVEIVATQIKINGDVTITGDANIAGISFKEHLHGNGNKGEDTTPPKR